MMLLCCFDSILESQIKWGEISEVFTALSTIALAFITRSLAKYAKRQLDDINVFNKRSENINHVQSEGNKIMKQIEFHYKILDRIESNMKEAFKIMYENLERYYGFERDNSPTVEEDIITAYGILYKQYGYLLGHYYRNLYRIFKNINDIDDEKFEGFDKRYYAKLVRAQLSEYEMILLFYNCIWVGELDENKFKKLIEKYELLEGINYGKLFDNEHKKLYSINAFGTDLS